MNYTNLSLKKGLLKKYVSQLNSLVAKGTAEHKLITSLVTKIKLLISELAHILSKRQIRRVLGSFVFLLGSVGLNNSYGQTFLPGVTNPFGLNPTGGVLNFIEFVDLDMDGDLDILRGGYYGDFNYYENTGSATIPQYATPTLNPFGLIAALGFSSPTLADFDNDGDFDLLSGSYYGSFQYFENTGTASNPQFTNPMTDPFGLMPAYYYAFPDVADLDGDGDFDLIVGEYYGALKYYENTGTPAAPQFAAPATNPFGLTSVYYFSFPELADFDNDGDFDVLVGEYYGNMKYFENTGNSTNPIFGAPVTNPFGIAQAYYIGLPASCDLDSDGDLDLMITDYYGAFTYYQNDLINSLDELDQKIAIYPNPFVHSIKMECDIDVSYIRVLDLSGKEVIRVENPENEVILQDLKSGNYLLEINLENDTKWMKQISKAD